MKGFCLFLFLLTIGLRAPARADARAPVWVIVDAIEQTEEFAALHEAVQQSAVHLRKERKIEVVSNATAADLLRVLRRDDVQAIFYVGHGQGSRNKGAILEGGRILDVQNNNVTPLFGSLGTNLRWLSLISCSTRSTIQAQLESSPATLISTARDENTSAVKNTLNFLRVRSRLMAQHPLVIDSPTSDIRGEKNLQRSLYHARWYMRRSVDGKESCNNVSSHFATLKVARAATPPEAPAAPTLLRIGKFVLGVLESGSSAQTWKFRLPLSLLEKSEDLRIVVQSISDTNKNLGAPELSIETGGGPELALAPALNPQGRPMGHGSSLLLLKGWRSAIKIDASNAAEYQACTVAPE